MYSRICIRLISNSSFFPGKSTRQLLEQIRKNLAAHQLDEARALYQTIAPEEQNSKYVKGCLAEIEQEERTVRYIKKLQQERHAPQPRV
jgi:hypothetical protein